MKRWLLTLAAAGGVCAFAAYRHDDREPARHHTQPAPYRFAAHLDPSDEAATRQAVNELQHLTDVEAAPAVRHLVETSDSPLVRANAIRTLGRIGDAPACVLLRTILANTAEPLRARQEAALALGELRDIDAVPLLMRTVATDEQDPAIELGLSAIQALGGFHDDAARELLQRVAATSSSQRARLFASRALRS